MRGIARARSLQFPPRPRLSPLADASPFAHTLSLSTFSPRPSPHFSLSHTQAEHAAAYLNFLSSLPPLSTARAASSAASDETSTTSPPAPRPPGPPLLGPQAPAHAGRPTLVLDLDHTLVRSVALHVAGSGRGAGARPGRVVLPRLPGTDPGAPLTAFDARPGLPAFLAAASSLFEVVVFTAGARSYADPVLDALDPAGTLFAARLYRDACIRVAPAPAARARLERAAAASASPPSSFRPPPPGGAWVMKDLAALGRPLARTLLVDNTPTVFGYQPGNGIPIPSWHGGGGGGGGGPAGAGGCGGGGRAGAPGGSCTAGPGPTATDSALLDLLPLLQACATAADVRPIIAAAFPATLGVVLAAVAAHPALFAGCAPSVLDAAAHAEAAAAREAGQASPWRSASPSASSAASAGTAAAAVAGLHAPAGLPPACPAATAANNALAAAAAALALAPHKKRPRSASVLPTPARAAPGRRGAEGGRRAAATAVCA